MNQVLESRLSLITDIAKFMDHISVVSILKWGLLFSILVSIVLFAIYGAKIALTDFPTIQHSTEIKFGTSKGLDNTYKWSW